MGDQRLLDELANNLHVFLSSSQELRRTKIDRIQHIRQTFGLKPQAFIPSTRQRVLDTTLQYVDVITVLCLKETASADGFVDHACDGAITWRDQQVSISRQRHGPAIFAKLRKGQQQGRSAEHRHPLALGQCTDGPNHMNQCR